MNLKINLLGHIKMLSSLIIITIALIIFMFYLKTDKETSLYILLPYTLIFILPVLIIHCNYYYLNNGNSFLLENNSILVKNKGNEIVYTNFQINEIEFIMTGKRASGMAYGNFPFENYYYCKLHLKDGKQLIISCLYNDNIDKILISNFKEIPIKYTTNFYPLI